MRMNTVTRQGNDTVWRAARGIAWRTALRTGLRAAACAALSAALSAATMASPAAAADDAALLKDLTSVIALLGLPCGQVVSATALKDDDHIASCQDGHRYRVFINAEGRVTAQRLNP